MQDYWVFKFSPSPGTLKDKAVPQLRRLITGFPPQQPGFEASSGHVGFVVDKVALGQVFPEYSGFPYQFSFHQLLNTHPSSGAATIGQLVADIPIGLKSHPTPRRRNPTEHNVSETGSVSVLR
jgi:hypothetical protein